MTFSIRWLFFIVSWGFTTLTLSAPICPCPGGKWMAPFRPSQLLYSEFPEDRGRSLHIDRHSAYETNSIVGDDSPSRLHPPPPPRSHIRETASDEYNGSYEPPNNSLQSTDYSDYDETVSNEAVDNSHEYNSDEGSSEYYNNGGYSEYRDNQGSEEDQGSFSLEDFELDEAVMKPPPPLNSSISDENDEGQEEGVEENDSREYPAVPPSSPPPELIPTSGSRETTKNPPTTQLEVPDEGELPPVQPTKPLQINYNTPVAPPPARPPPLGILRSPPNHHVTSGLLGPQHSGYSHWRNVLNEVELSNLRVMKPPPLGQAQTWRATVHRFRRRPT